MMRRVTARPRPVPFCLVVKNGSNTRLIFSTVMPAHPLDLAEIEKGFDERKAQLLQEIFLAAVRKSGDPSIVTLSAVRRRLS